LNRPRILYSIALLLAALVSYVLITRSTPHDLPTTVDFNYHIRPILASNCYACHGPDSVTAEAGLQLHTYAAATAERKDGPPAIIPRKPGKSLLIKRISSTDPDFHMPPPESDKKLSAREKALLEKWIKQGAEWKPHWALIQPDWPKLPRSLRDASPSEIIDYLVTKQLKENNLTFSSPSSKDRLLRRLAYMLTGLPPASTHLEQFLTSVSPNTYDEQVDYYLASPHFGERWARHWMDLVRYSETQGHEDDAEIGGVWHYRDYLIRAFNADVPYDQFVLEHLAGDLLDKPRRHPETGVNESILGTGFITMGEAKAFPLSIRQEETERINTMIDVTSTAFQALSVACARCHDHKFDPIPTKDYYAMYGMFETTRITPWSASVGSQKQQVINELRELKKSIQKQAQELVDFPDTSPPIQPITLESAQVRQDTSFQIIGNFRKEQWGEWYTDGDAFGDGPVQNEIVYDQQSKQFVWFDSPIASSRAYASQVNGMLRSPTFIIDDDSLLVRLRANRGTARVIIDSYQPISDLLYGDLDHVIDTLAWQDLVINVSTWKGQKAYIEFMPGRFIMQQLTRDEDDFIEIAFAISYSGERPESLKHLPFPEQELVVDQLPELLAQRYDSLSTAVYDSTYFIGLTTGTPVHSPVFIRGDYKSLSDEQVPHGFLTAVDAGPAVFPQNGMARLAWAQSVADPTNPLTARIMVNRIWHYLFGKGIVETVDNFGIQGKLPDNPELLDYLALQFIEQGWSIKSLIRHIVMTETFQRSTESLPDNQVIDPENRFLHHYPVRRLEAEAIRDGVLAVSGRLDSTMYGPSVEINYEPFRTFRPKVPDSGPIDGEGRRSVYQKIRRNYLNPLMLTFDMPFPYETMGKRNVTYTPAQSLSLMNDPFFHQQAQVLAEHLLAQNVPSTEARIQYLYKRAFAREASSLEVDQGRAFLAQQAALQESTLDSTIVWADYCHNLFNLKEFIHLL